MDNLFCLNYNVTKWLKTKFLIPDPIQTPSVIFPIYLWRFFLLMETGFQVSSALGSPIYLSIYGVLSKLWNAMFVASWIVLSKSGTAKNSLFCSILSDSFVENSAICVQIYRRNASLRLLLLIIIMSGYTPARYIAIAAPEWMECAPICVGPKLSCPLLRIWTAELNFVQFTAEFIVNFPLLSMKVLNWSFVFGSVTLYDRTRVTVFPQ